MLFIAAIWNRNQYTRADNNFRYKIFENVRELCRFLLKENEKQRYFILLNEHKSYSVSFPLKVIETIY